MSAKTLIVFLIGVCLVVAWHACPAAAVSAGEDTARQHSAVSPSFIARGAEETAAPSIGPATIRALTAAMWGIGDDVRIAPLPGAAGMGFSLLAALTLRRRRRGRGPQPKPQPKPMSAASRFSPRRIAAMVFSA